MRHGLVTVPMPMCGLAHAIVAAGIWAQAQPPQQARFVGRVYDAARRPVDRVEVVVNRREVRATSDGFGVFHLDLAPGDSTVGFRRIGYRPLLLSLHPLPPQSDTILVELVPSPIELAEVIVTGSPSKPLRYAGTMKYDEVFERRKIGLGKLIPREVIDRRPGARTYQLLEGVAGVLVFDAPVRRVRLVRCQEPGAITVWIDGFRQVPTDSIAARMIEETPETEMMSRVNPSDIEMIEVFRGPAEIPGVFHWNGCAVIAIWTKWNK